MCQAKKEGGRRCISHHPGTRVALALVRATHPELDEQTSKELIRRLNREATAAGMRGETAHPDQVEAMFVKMEIELEYATIQDPTYRAYCQKRLKALRDEFEADPTSVDEAKLHVWKYLATAATPELARKHRSEEGTHRIGVDMDGVVYDCHAVMGQFMKACGYPEPEETQKEYDLSKHWGVSKDVIWKEFQNAVRYGTMFRHGEPLADGVAAVRRLYESGHRIVIITARDLPGLEKECRKATVRWLRDNGIPFDELHLTGEKEKVNIDVLLDDAPSNVDRVVGHGTEGIVIDRPFNRLEGHGHARRSWADVVRELSQPEPEDVLFTIEPELSAAARDREVPLGAGSTAGRATVA